MNSGKSDLPRSWDKGRESDKDPLVRAWLTSPLLPSSPMHTPVMTPGHLNSVAGCSVTQGPEVIPRVVPSDDTSTGSFQRKFPESRVSQYSNSWVL